MFQDLIQSPIFALFIIVALGFMLGRISIRGISLDISAVIFVALLFGHYGVIVPDVLSTFGMVLFIFTIGIQAGPGFFSSFKSKGIKFLILAFVVVFTSAAVAVATKYIFGFDIAQTVGLLTGALTSTPGLAAAKELAGANSAVAYGIAYPFGVIGVILFVKLLPALTKTNIKDIEEKAHIDPDQQTIVISKVFRVANSGVFGKSLMELKVRTMTGAVVSRISHEGVSIIPKATTKIYEGDLIKAVGYVDALQRVGLLIGIEVAEQLPLAHNNVVKVALVSEKAIVNTTLEQLHKEYDLPCTVTCVRRSGIDIQASPSLELKLGDKLTIVGPDDSVKEFMKLIGNDKEALSDVDLFPVATGIVLGMLFGKISIDFGGSLSFSFGLTGGVLLIALLLSAKGRTGPIVWTMSSNSNQLLRQLGLLLFLAGVGTSAGATMVSTFMEYGWNMLIAGVLITLIPMIVVAVVGMRFMKMNLIDMFGVITGGMTSTPGLAAADSMCRSNAPGVAYATIYPLAMVFLIIAIQLITYIL